MPAPRKRFTPPYPILFCVPFSADAEIIQGLLPAVEARGILCADIREIARRSAEIGEVILISEKVLDEEGLDHLITALNRQPDWSDLPVMLVSASGPESPVSQRAMQAFTNVLLLNHPLHLRTLTSALRMALRARERQYRVRELLEAQKQAEENLRDSERRFRAFLDASFDVVYSMSPDWNEMRRLQGRDFIPDTDEPSSNWLERYIVPDDQPHVLSVINEAIRTKSIFELVHRVLRLDGTLGWIWSRAVPLLDANGHIVEWIGAARDITESKYSREELQRLNETLEQRVADRTRQLRTMAVQLIEAEERERQRISQLLHDDLQQMLAAAKVHLQTVCHNLPPEPMLTDVGLILDESIAKARRLSHELSPTVLRYSGLKSGLRWLAGQMKEQFDLDVELAVEENFRLDQTFLKEFLFRAVQELLFNTAKHAGVKRVRVAIENAKESLTIRVIDSGSGFDPQARLEQDKKTGLGLLSIKERAAHIGGCLEIESAPGEGSCFTLTVPFKVEVGDKRETQTDSRDTSPDKPRSAAGLRVLFCDDHHLIRRSLVQMVNKQQGVRVVGEASDGTEAVKLCRQLTPDVVVMDISMPGMDGIEATRRIKSEQPQVRVVGLSMHDDEYLSGTMRAAGADFFVSKNAKSAELLQAIFAIACE
jgi:signal transduction histidine kinase